MSFGRPLAQRDCSYLTPPTYDKILKRSRPPQRDTSFDDEMFALKTRHDNTVTETANWPNTIVRNRIEKQTRLQKEKEEEELEKLKIDEDEKNIRKAQRKEALEIAEQKRLAQQPEIRSVNSQLMLQEVQRERMKQQRFTEARNINEMKRQIVDDATIKREYLEECERENQKQREIKQKARDTAEGFKAQKIAAEERKLKKIDAEVADDRVFLEQTLLQVEEDKKQAIAKKQRDFLFAKQVQLENIEIAKAKDRLSEIDIVEDKRIQEIQLRAQEDQIHRREIANKKKEDLFASRDGLYEAARTRQASLRSVQDEFYDKQVEEHEAREAAKIQAETDKKRRIAEERRQDFLNSQKITKEKDPSVKIKVPFNLGEDDVNEVARQQRLESRLQNIKDLAQFQLQQAKEKREREDAEKERVKLEFQRDVELDQRKIEEAQNYAREKLQAFKYIKSRK